MPNYNLVVTSKFNPFTYEQMLAPIAAATEAHQKVEDAYNELDTKASIWEGLADEQADHDTYIQYKNYANALRDKAYQLASEGLTPTSRRDMLDLKARYSKEITPIEQAYAARQEQAKEQQKALLSDNTMLFNRKAATTSLDKYLKNPLLSYEAYSGNLLAQQVSTAASALAKQIRENPRKWRDILDDSYYETLMQKGFNSADVYEAVSNNPKAAKELLKIVDDTIEASGIPGWGDEEVLKEAKKHANRGLWSAVGETSYQVLNNWRAQAENELTNKTRLANASDTGIAINPVNIYSDRKKSREEKEYAANTKKYQDYFTKENGEWVMTPKGKEVYNKKVSTPGTPTVTPEGVIIYNESAELQDSPFKRFMDSLGVKDINSAGKAWGDYVENSPGKTAKYDAKKRTEFNYTIAPSEQEAWKQAILTANRGKVFEEQDFDDDSNAFITINSSDDKDDNLTAEKLNDSNYKVIGVNLSTYGNTMFVKDDKGVVKRYLLPPGISPTNEEDRDKKRDEAQYYSDIINTGKFTDENGVEHTLNKEELADIENRYKEALQNMYKYNSQLVVTNKTKDQEHKPIAH